MIANTEDLITRFGWADYLVFIMMLFVSTAIGVFFGCSGTKQKSTTEFFMGGRTMGVFPVAMSLAASFYSASGLMGAPAETYRYGSMQAINVLTYIVLVPAVSHLYVPMFHRLQVASSFEYLERRFNVTVRRIGSLILIIQMMLYMATAVWAPALALSQVTGMDVYVSVTVNFIVCAFYTTMGGIKAVLWTDAFQFSMMLISMSVVMIKGNMDVGGTYAVINASMATDRLEFFDFNPDPTVRHTFWSLLFGGYFMWLAIFGVNQTQVQRYMSMPTIKDVRKALFLCFLLVGILDTALYYLGLVIYTRYKDCDPIETGLVKKIDQLVPLFVMDTLGGLPGIPGLLVAGLYSASLSTVSSGLNSLAAVTLEDYVRPLLLPNMTDAKATKISKLLSIAYGFMAYGLVYLMANLSHLVEAVLSIFGLAGGPLLGVFTLGMYFPWANSVGAIIGLVSSVTIMFWIGFGAMILRAQGVIVYARKSVSTEGCDFLNATITSMFTNATTTAIPDELPIVDEPLAVYGLSYQWYSFGGFILVIVIGLVSSAIRGFQDPKTLDPELVFNTGDTLFWYLPKNAREFLRFNVGDNHAKNKDADEPEKFPLTATLEPTAD